jgi:hypothetical protein
MDTGCRACRLGLDHCHGALIHHPYRRDECTEDDCFTPGAGHDVHLDCEAVGCSCAEAFSVSASAHRVG